MASELAKLIEEDISKARSEGDGTAYVPSSTTCSPDGGAANSTLDAITIHKHDFDDPTKFSWKDLMHFAGPGFLMCIAYIDPGNFESDLQAGAQFGYKLLWVLLWAHVMGFIIQTFTIRLALGTRMHLARMCRDEYPRRVRIALWLLTELAIVASDVPEVIGTAFALKLLFNLPLWIGVLITGLDTMLFLMIQMLGVRKLEALIGALVGAMSLCFLLEMGMAHEEMLPTVEGLLVPRLPNGEAMYIAISLLGAVVMPHNLYLHSALTLTREIPPGAKYSRAALMYNSIESAAALLVALAINIAVVIVCAATIKEGGLDEARIQEIIDNPLQNVPYMLRNVLGGKAASTFFGIALLASGQSSTMTGTYAGQFVMEGFLDMKINPALRNFLTRSVAIIPSLTVALLAGDQGSEGLIVLSSVVLSFQLPFGLIPLVKFVSDEKVVGPMVVSGRMQRVGHFLSALVIAANVGLLLWSVHGAGLVDGSLGGLATGVLVAAVLLGYTGSLLWLVMRPVEQTIQVCCIS
mmetsp:Transcript_65075/g.205648  ORF Transcript_65075/g.205648 Transcript_65075/m.205648 type:complete len:522 (-) Transcript_65075:33-1598(-)